MRMTPTRKLADAEVFPIGLGGMPMSLAGRPPEERSIRTIHAALDAGVNLIDTADAAWELDGSPEHIRRACEASLKALETERIDLYQYHRPDPTIPYAETIGAFKELQDEGKVRWIGISNANVDQIEETRAMVHLVSVQNQLSLEYPFPLE